MSVSHKKINGLIENIINNASPIKINNNKTEIKKEKLIDLCQKIYLLESSTSSVSRNQMVDEICKEIVWHSPKLIRE